MKYLYLICVETLMEQMPEADAEKHYEEYSEFTKAIRSSDVVAAVFRRAKRIAESKEKSR